MKIIFGEDKGYSTVDNGELNELNHDKSKIQDILSSFGNYKLKQTSIMPDPDFSFQKNLIVIAKDEKGKPSIFAFDKYGIKYVKLNDRKVSTNLVREKKQYLDLTVAYLSAMIEVNNENYKNSALAFQKNAINYAENRIKLLESTTPKTEKERVQIQEEIMERHNSLLCHKYILDKVNEQISSTSSASEK